MNKMRILTKINYFLRYQTKIPGLEDTITGMRNSLELFNSTLQQAEKTISELKQRSLEIIKSEEQKGKRRRKSEA